MRYLSIVSVLATVDAGQHVPTLKTKTEAPVQKLSDVLVWTGSTAKGILATYRKNTISLSVHYI